MKPGGELHPRQLDALREVANVGAGHAATALSEMTRRPVQIAVPRVSATRLSDAAQEIGEPAVSCVGVALEIVGDVTGRTLLLMDGRSARGLVDILTGRERDGGDAPSTAFDENETSALEELGNILTSAYASALSDFLGLVLLPSVPRLRTGTLVAVLAEEERRSGGDARAVLLVETRFRFRNAGEELAGHFILVPDAHAVSGLLAALGVER